MYRYAQPSYTSEQNR
jgi:hypothetical protein